jgi:hypothetical protein
MEWLVDVQVASRGCGSPVCLHTSRLGTEFLAMGACVLLWLLVVFVLLFLLFVARLGLLGFLVWAVG